MSEKEICAYRTDAKLLNAYNRMLKTAANEEQKNKGKGYHEILESGGGFPMKKN